MMQKLRLITALLLLASISSYAQQTISGVITDANNQRLPGVNVVIQGTTTGTTSDLDGHYSLSVNSDDVLLFSFIGYEGQSITVGTKLRSMCN